MFRLSVSLRCLEWFLSQQAFARLLNEKEEEDEEEGEGGREEGSAHGTAAAARSRGCEHACPHSAYDFLAFFLSRDLGCAWSLFLSLPGSLCTSMLKNTSLKLATIPMLYGFTSFLSSSLPCSPSCLRDHFT